MLVKILGVDEREDGKYSIVFRMGNDIRSIVATQAELSDIPAIKASIAKLVNVQKYVGLEYDVP